MSLESIVKRSAKAESKIHFLLGKKDMLAEQKKKLKEKLNKLNKELNDISMSIEVLQVLSEIKKKKIKVKIESLVTQGLKTIFNRDDLRFVLDMEQKRGVMNAKPMLVSKFSDKEFTATIIDSHGGGIVDIVSLILQVIVLLSIRPQLNHILIMDEAFKHVSREYLSNVANFISYLNEITGIQFIIVTHKPELAECADKVFKVNLDSNGITRIKETAIE